MAGRAGAWMQGVLAHAAAASADAGRWAPLVEDLARVFSASSVALFTPQPAAHVQPLGIVHGDLAAGTEPYFADWAHNDAWLEAVKGTDFFQRAGEARFSQEFLPDAALRRTAFFNDWARRYGAEQSLALKVTDDSDRDAPVMHLTLFRHLADKRFTAQDRTRLQVLWPHLRRAANAYWLLQPVRDAVREAEAALDLLPLPAWVVRADAQVDHANASARRLVTAGFPVRERHGRLANIGRLDAAALCRQIRLYTTPPGRTGTLALSTGAAGRWSSAVLHVVPIAQSALYACTWPHAAALLMLQSPVPAEHGELWLAWLAQRHGLTPAHLDILRCLAEGKSLGTIAQERGTGLGTVRFQLHELLARTGCARQQDLVRLALGA